MIELVVWLAVLIILVIVAWYLLSQITLPEPAGQIIRIVIVVVIAVVAIGVLLSLTGVVPVRLRPIG